MTNMKIGVVSDTHGHLANTLAAARMLESLEVEAVLHCGDIGSPQVPKLLASWPAHFVFGNCDRAYEEAALREAIDAVGLVCHGRFGDIHLGGRRIALIHSDDARRFRETIAGGAYDLVCYGHTHFAESHRAGKTLVLNPGALFRATPHTIALVDLASLEATIVAI